MDYVLYYHTKAEGFTGRAFAPLCIMDHAGLRYEVREPQECPAESCTFAPPMLKCPDGQYLGQTPLICAELARAANLELPDSLRFKGMQLVLDACDMLAEIVSKKGSERIKTWVSHLEGFLEDDKPFMLGQGSLTYVDYAVLACFMIFPAKQKKGVEDFKGVVLTPKLHRWFNTMMKTEAVRKRAHLPYVPDSMV